MSRQRHDHLAKGLLTEWLTPLGTLQPSRRLQAEERFVDVVAHSFRRNRRWREALGLLGKIAHRWTAFEVFRNPVTATLLQMCGAKQVDLNRDLRRRRGSRPGEAHVWVVTPTLSKELRQRFRLLPLAGWPSGFLDAGGWGIRVIVVHDLPSDASTLFLRIFGRDHVQQQALDELSRLPVGHPLRRPTMRRVVNFGREAEQASRPTAEQKEFVMKNRDYFDVWESRLLKRGAAKGKEEGKAEGKAESVLTVLETRGLNVPARVRTRVRACTKSTQLDRLLRRAVVVETAAELFR